jgi:outer membrane protein assembly factor BamB
MPTHQLLYIADATFFGDTLSAIVTAVDAQTGTKHWQTILAPSHTTERASLQLVDDVLYALYASPGSTFPDTLTALDARDGKVIWQHQKDGKNDEQISKIYVDQDILCLYVTYRLSKATIEVYRVQDYQRQWHSTTTRILLLADCLFTKNIAYNISYPRLSLLSSCTVRALHSSNGKELWHSTLALTIKKMVATEHSLYIAYNLTSSRGSMEVRALSPDDGSLFWKSALKNKNPLKNMMVLNNVLYLEGFSYLTALDALDGRHLWTLEQSYSPQFQTNDHLLYAYHDHRELCALDPQSGTTLWCSQIREAGSFTVTTENNAYTAASYSGTVHALRKSNGQPVWSYENDSGRRIFGLAVGES